MAKHAALGASSAKRWMNCPGSIRLIAGLPRSERERSSPYADEGSAAHGLAEHCLTHRDAPDDYLGWSMMNDPDTDDWVPRESVGPGDYAFEVTDEMVEAVEVYLAEIQHHLDRLPNGSIIGVEARVQPLDRGDCFGTADVLVADDFFGELVVADFKYGKGVVVEVEHNEQAMVYGLGALRGLSNPGDYDTVTLVVVQPRAPHPDGRVRRWSLPARELLEWGDTLNAAADRTRADDAPLKAGEWCRFCPALPTCPEARKAVMDAAQLEFSPVRVEPGDSVEMVLPDAGDPEQLAQALNIVPLMDHWCREVEGLAQRLAEAGTRVPGYKLVRKRSNRRWMDEKEAERVLRNKRGVKVGDIYTKKLKSPAQMERLKPVGEDWVKKYAHKPEGGLTLAHEADPRPAEGPPAIADFAGHEVPAEAGGDPLADLFE